MKYRITTLALAAALASSLTLSAIAQTAAAPAAAASAPTGPTIRQDLGKPLLEVQKLVGEKQFAQAREKLQAAYALPDQTPYETFITARVGFSVAMGEDDATTATKLADQILQLDASGKWLSKEDLVAIVHSVGVANYRAKDYASAARWLERTVEAGATEANVRDLRISAYLMAGDMQKGSDLLAQDIAATEKAGAKPDLKHLQLLYQARNNMKDVAGATKAAESMVLHYPSKDNWRIVMARLWAKPELPQRLQLDVFRLSLFNGTLDEASDYSEYAEMAQRAGYSAEALSVFDKGAALGLLGSTDAHKKLRAKLVQDLEQDKKTQAADLAAAQKKPDGLALFNLGMNLVAAQQTDKGLDLMEKGLAKGLAKNPMDARLRLGAAYAQAGQADKATQAFANVSGSDGTDEIVRYWKWAIRKP